MDKRRAISVPLGTILLGVLLAGVPAAAQELPLVSRQLQFHAPAGVAATATSQDPDDDGYTEVPVILTNIPRTPLPPGATILNPQIDPATGLYTLGGGEPGANPVVLPPSPAQQPESAVPRLVVGQVYVPPWWNQVRNARGGLGPADPGPRNRGVQPEDLRITPPEPAPTPDAAPEAAPAPSGQSGAAPTAPSAAQPAAAQPAAQPEAPIPLVSRRLGFRY